MAEVIKTILTADSSELRSEFSKASAAAVAYQTKLKEQSGRALQGMRGTLDALRLEAGGHKQAADALRAKMSLEDQSRRLAAQAGITQEDAVRILQRKLELEQSIAATQQAAANRPAPSLPQAALTPQSLQMMERNAALHGEMRRQMLNAGKGGYTGAMGVLAFSQAVEDAQYGIRGVLNNIPQMVLGFGGGAGIAGAISLAAVAGVALYPILKRLYGAADTERIEKASKAWADLFKEGIKAVNVAGAEANLNREMLALAQEHTQAVNDRLRVQGSMITVIETEIARRQEAKQLADEVLEAEEALRKVKGQRDDGGAQRRNTDQAALNEDLSSQREILARASAEAARLRMEKESIQQQYRSQAESRDRELMDLRRSLAASEANLAEQRSALETTPLGKESGLLKSSIKSSETVRAKIESSIKQMEAERDALKAVEESAMAQAGAAIDQMEQRISKSYEESEALKVLIAQRQKLGAIDAEKRAIEEQKIRDEQSSAGMDFEEEGRFLAAKATLNDDLVKSIERQRAIEELKLQIMKDQGLVAETALRMATERVDLERQAADAAEQARRAQDQQTGKEDFAAELQALELEANGNKDLADELREQIRIRRESVGLAEQLGVSEEDAIRLLQEKAQLQEEINEAKKNGDRETRGISAAETIRGLRLGSLGDTRRLPTNRGDVFGLRNSEMRRREGERVLRREPSDEGRKLLSRSVDLQQQMVKIFSNLGIV